MREREIQGSPILTFQAIKQGFLEKEHLSNRKVFLPCENKLSRNKNQVHQGLKQSNSLAHLGTKRDPHISNNIRLGSMVFSSLPKKKDNQPLTAECRDSKSYEKGLKPCFYEVECMNKDGHPVLFCLLRLNIKLPRHLLKIMKKCFIIALIVPSLWSNKVFKWRNWRLQISRSLERTKRIEII